MFRASRGAPGDRGAAAMEFALVVPILLMLVFGIVDFGFLINRASLINNAARDAARLGSLSATEDEIETAAEGALDGLSVTVTVTCLKADGSTCTGYDADAESGGTTIVTIDYTHDMITPVAAIFADSVDVSRTAEMRIE